MKADGSSCTNLHVFGGGAGDGGDPPGDLILSGTTFYGMALEGGAANQGAVFRVNTDGTGYTNLHEFAGNPFAGYPNDGSGPAESSLTLDGSTLYGMTQQGGSNNIGAVFKMNTDGSSYTNLHSFAGGVG